MVPEGIVRLEGFDPLRSPANSSEIQPASDGPACSTEPIPTALLRDRNATLRSAGQVAKQHLYNLQDL